MCWDGEQGKSFEEAMQELYQMTENKEDFFEELGAAIIGFMFGIPIEMSQQAIDEMKEKQEVKDIINKYKQCQNEET